MRPCNDSAETTRIRRAVNAGMTIAAVLFVGWHLASFVSLLREIRDRIQDHNVIIDLNIEEKRIDDVTPQTPKPIIDGRPQFWRGS